MPGLQLFEPTERACQRCGGPGPTLYGLRPHPFLEDHARWCLRCTVGTPCPLGDFKRSGCSPTWTAVVCCERCYLDCDVRPWLALSLSVAEWLKRRGFEVPKDRCPWAS